MNIDHHLSVRSDFSVGESLLSIDKMVEQAKVLGYKSLALVDTNLSGMVDFSNRCKKAGIKPIIGFRVRVVVDPTYRTPSKASGVAAKPNPFWIAKVYLKSDKALVSVFKLLTKANSKEYFYYVPRVGLDDLLKLEDVVVTSGDFFGLHNMPSVEASTHHAELVTHFRDDFYGEIVPGATPLWDTVNARVISYTFPEQLLAGYPALYAERDDADAKDVLAAVVSNTKMDAGSRSVPYLRDFALESPKKLIGRVTDSINRAAALDSLKVKDYWVKALASIEVIASKCSYSFEKLPISLPAMAVDEFSELQRLCVVGWKKRFAKEMLGHQPTKSDLTNQYKPRLAYELSILKKMNFSGYFLLVADLVSWAKNNDIIVGPGRGSVGGSLVAYLMGITDVDPIRFNLLFERFINPDRIDLPDADLDFMSSKRHLVVDYLVKKYGDARVAGISNYSSLASSSALRDTGRVFGLSNFDLQATKLVPKEHGQPVKLLEAVKTVPELERLRDSQPVVWKHALKLEGAMRAFSQHAAGIVVAGEDLQNRAVLETRSTDLPVVNWDKRVVEDWGLVKMDLLGLSTLDILDIAADYIEERHAWKIDYNDIKLDDSKILDAFGRGETTGVFQFESGGMRRLLRDLRRGSPLTFDDVTAATALYRPGPMDAGLLEDYVAIKQGHRVPHYEHPNMEPALRDTYGVIVYQEQVMQIARDIAGYTMADADKLRKIMGKKLKEEMEKEREKWVKGCEAHSSMVTATASALFDKIAAFAGYGFNKSHAVEYSIISFWTMFLRVYYPAEYFAACLSIVGEDKLSGLVADAREAGIKVLPPDANLSGARYVISPANDIIAPFNAMLGCSEATANRIVELRDAEPLKRFIDFANFADVCSRKGSKVNVTVVKRLNLVGGFHWEPGQSGPLHMNRRKDQLEFLPGLIIDVIKADRVVDMTIPIVRSELIEIIKDYGDCSGCSLAGQPHPTVRMKSTVKFMVVSDCPTFQEEAKGRLLEGDTAKFIKASIVAAGMKASDGYYTTLVKAKKDGKMLTNEQMNGCSKFLDRELDLIKPPVIVALGSATVRRLLPDLKGSSEELQGKAIYVPARDATIVCGINPAQILFKPEKQDVLDAIFEKVADIVT